MIAQLLHLQSESQDSPIHLYINSPGGSITALLAVYDTIQYIKPTVATFCLGQAASAAAVLLAAGTPGNRHVLEHARVLLHQPSGGERAPRPTWRSRPGRSAGCASRWTRSCTATPGSRWPSCAPTPSAT